MVILLFALHSSAPLVSLDVDIWRSFLRDPKTIDTFHWGWLTLVGIVLTTGVGERVQGNAAQPLPRACFGRTTAERSGASKFLLDGILAWPILSDYGLRVLLYNGSEPKCRPPTARLRQALHAFSPLSNVH